jgi:hypothetical protein
MADPTRFAAAGGQVKSDEDMARMLGVQAEHRAQTGEAQGALADITARGEIQKNKQMADLTMRTADEYDQHVQSLMSDANRRWADWKTRNQAAADQQVDPKHAFHNMSTLSRIGWVLSFLSSGLGSNGGAGVDQVQNQLNKLVEQDMAAQSANIANKRKGLESEKDMLQEQDKMGKDAISDWYFAKNLRFQAVGKQLDAEIAAMGLPAARAAGKLAARDAVEKLLLDGEEKIGQHYFTSAERKAGEAHAVYMARLQSQLRMTEDLYKEQLKAGADKGDTLPTGTNLGLQMVDKSTGQAVPGGKVKLRVKGEKAVEAGQILSSANEEGSLLKSAADKLQGMTTADLLRGGSAEFRSIVQDLVQARAVRDNGHRITDQDILRAGEEELGAAMRNSIIGTGKDAITRVGGYKEGIQKTIDTQRRNLATKTVNKLSPYIDSDDAQKYNLKFNINDTQVVKPSETPDDMNTALTKAAGGGPVSDLVVPGPRVPVGVDVPTPLDTQIYQAEKVKGRGNQGGLPRLSDDEEAKIDRASAAFQNAPVDDILRLAKAYLRDPGLSTEAKKEIRVESQAALQVASEREDAIREEALKTYTGAGRTGKAQSEEDVGRILMNSPDAPKSAYDASGNFTEDFRRYLESDLVNQMRKRAGLEPRSR